MSVGGFGGLVRLALAVCLCAAAAAGQTRRALIVGIDKYIQPSSTSNRKQLSARTKARLSQVRGTASRVSITPLDGAVRDARDMASLLSRRFDFKPENVHILLNEQATGDAILSGLEQFLVAPAAKGDVSVFYFAGHGSRIRNRSTRNVSGLDSTILPADSMLGVPDLRSKELARIYLDAVARGVDLTVIQDSCFSGGGARGVIPGRRVRAQEPVADISVDESLDRNPEDEGVLVLSASQDYQPAQETETETGSHGAFTWALLNALETSGPNERATRIFERTRALLQSRVNDQDPVMSQSKRRLGLGMFAQPADSAHLGGTAAVGFIRAEDGTIELNGGITLGLRAGCELKRVIPASPSVRIRVTEVNGPSSSNATLLSGERGSVRVGDLFQIDRWTAAAEPVLNVYTGQGIAADELKRLIKLAGELGSASALEVAKDPTADTADFVLYHDVGWKLVEMNTRRELLRSRAVPGMDEVLQVIPEKPGSAQRIAILFPPVLSVSSSLRRISSTETSSIGEARSPDKADYILAGTLVGSAVEYAWVRPGETQADLDRESFKAATNHREPPPPAWPLRTDWTRGDESQVVAGLSEQIRGLARIAGWLRLRTPVPADDFPYRLALRESSTGNLAGTTVQGGHSYKLVLDREPGVLPAQFEPRWIYVFVIDSFGQGTLVFPRNGNVGNRFPHERDAAGALLLPERINMTKEKADIEAAAPYGIDNYFMLTTAQPIDNPGSLFNGSGVRTRSGTADVSPLGRLILSVDQGERGAVSGVPTTWSIDRMAIRSVAPESARRNSK